MKNFFVRNVSAVKEHTLLSLSLLISVALLVVLNLSIPYFFELPIPSLLTVSELNEIFAKNREVFLPEAQAGVQPEPLERLRYVLSLILGPFFLLFSYCFIKHINLKFFHNIKNIYLLSYIFCISLLLLLFYFDVKHDPISFIFYTEDVPYKDLRDVIFPKLIPNLTFILFGIPLLYFLVKNDVKYKIPFIFSSYKILSYILLVSLFFSNLFNDASYQGWMAHFNAVYYSVGQVVNGNSLLVDFPNMYGFYPHFLLPVFHVLGLSVFKFSLVMASLNFIAFFSLYYVISKIISSPFVRFATFLSVIFLNYLLMRVCLGYWDVYFAYWPIRFVFPCVLLLFSTIYFTQRQSLLYYLSFPLFTAGVLWNLDSGIVVYLAWLAILCFDEFFFLDKKTIFKKVMRHFFFSALFFLGTVLFFSLYIFIRSGNFPDWVSFLKFQESFYISGFGMMYMPLFSIWNMIILMYIIGLLFSINALFEKRNTLVSRLIFLLSILGLGIFSYYQGRSHDHVVYAVAYPATILLGIYADALFAKFKEASLLFPEFIYLLVSGFIFIITFNAIFFTKLGLPLLKQAERGISAIFKTETVSPFSPVDFIRHYSKPNEKVFIICERHTEGFYYALTKTRSAVNIPSSSEILLKQDLEREILFLNNHHDYKVYVNFKFASEDIKKILTKHYIVIATDSSGMKLLKWNKSFPK